MVDMSDVLIATIITAFRMGPTGLPPETFVELMTRATDGSEAAKQLLISLAQSEIQAADPEGRHFIKDGKFVDFEELLEVDNA